LGSFVASLLMEWETFTIKSSASSILSSSSINTPESTSFPIGAQVAQYGYLYPLIFAALVGIASIGLGRSAVGTQLRVASVGLAVVIDGIVWAILQSPAGTLLSSLSTLFSAFGAEVKTEQTLAIGGYLALAGAPLLALGMLAAALDSRPAKVMPVPPAVLVPPAAPVPPPVQPAAYVPQPAPAPDIIANPAS